MDTFQKYPNFIDSDIRINRNNNIGYTITHDLMLARHQILLSKESIKDLSILDLGCCVAATGAWVLDNGASEYVGVELQKKFVDQSIKNLSQSFSQANWTIIESSLENFLDQNTQQYDVVFAGGIIYSSLYYQEIITKITKIAKKSIVIESILPNIIAQNLHPELYARMFSVPEFYPIVEYHDNRRGGMVYEDGGNFKISCAVPSVQALAILLEEFGFYLDPVSYNNFKNNENAGWPARFGAVFEKKSDRFPRSVQNLYNNQIQDTIPWSFTIPEKWKFDENVARTFSKHVRKHIPDYDKVIDLSVLACKTFLKDTLHDRIIDVGCATGETIHRLYFHNCCNLIGVDSSQAMLDRCNQTQAFYICSNDFPIEHGPYNAVLCNWTMHFMQNKSDYLQKIYQGLVSGGMLILTEKTQNHGPALELYHKFKSSQGVSKEEIKSKAESLKDIMFINDIDWYTKTLTDIGFVDISIINAAPCFTSFLAFKPTK